MSLLPNSKVKVTSASGVAIFADSSPAPEADLNGRAGWLYTKGTGAEKFNYYVWSQGSRPITLGEIKSLSMVGSVDTYTNGASVPFIVVYTKATGVGDAGVWYHSRISYSIDATQVIMLGEKVQFYHSHSHPGINYGVRQIPLNTIITDGDAVSTEEILYITLHSDSGGADNTQILISNFGFETTVKNIEINLELDGN